MIQLKLEKACWGKENAECFALRPDQIVLGHGSDRPSFFPNAKKKEKEKEKEKKSVIVYTLKQFRSLTRGYILSNVW